MASLGVPGKKITVVYNATAEGFRPVNSDSEKKSIQAEFSGSGPYFLHVGMIHERKNITGLIKAFSLFRDKHDGRFCLIVAGGKQWWTREMQQSWETSPFREDILFPGKVSDEDLRKLYRAAEALVYPSFFEGFGIPVVEAFESGIPVITSDRSALPEIAGRAALLINPDDPESIAEAMLRIVKNEELRRQLISLGAERSALFSWDKSAQTIAEILSRYARN
jgi:glycosyltransferase involved in cell wall biosynthesis